MNTSHSQLRIFIANIYRIPYFLDLREKSVTVNDEKLTTNFKILNGRVKGVGGSPAAIQRLGKITLPLKPDCGALNNIPYIMSCMFQDHPKTFCHSNLCPNKYRRQYMKQSIQ